MIQNTELLTLSEFQRLSNELIKNFGGLKGRWWLDAFKRFLRGENPWDVHQWNFSANVTFGGLMNPKALRKIGSKDRNSMCAEAYQLLKSLETTQEQGTVEVMVVPIKLLGIDLGTRSYVSLHELNTQILKLGYHLFTTELIFNFHHQYLSIKDTLATEGHTVHIAMESAILKDAKKVALSITNRNRYIFLNSRYGEAEAINIETVGEIAFIKKIN